ncbi:50S ribosomal protein L6 [Candidatus Gracilibacteria bacterium]|nr:50S ribosomal protein L6 [Candidatus Gracilibacteria bacterium]
MSRIGKKSVLIPQGVEVSVIGDKVVVKGPKGTLEQSIEQEFVSVKVEDGQVIVDRKNDEKTTRARHGLYRSLINNLIDGVSTGFTKQLEIRGVGYRGQVNGKVLEMNLGYSHPIKYTFPEGIEVKFEEKSQTLLSVFGIDKQLVGSIAAKIRSYRKPEPYKGKGIRYADEHVAIKAGKSAKK